MAPLFEIEMLIRLAKLVAAGAKAAASPFSALWTFPSILGSAFIIAWGAEAAQFLMSQGLALAILAWLQTLPEFAVEAVIAWEAGKDPSQTHLAIANFTGSLRLLVGLGWPMIYFVAAAFAWKRRTPGAPRFIELQLDEEHAVEVIGLALPIAYFVFIWAKGSLTLWDAIPLTLTYVAYLFVLWKIPPKEGDEEAMEDLGTVPRKVLALPPRQRMAAIWGLFIIGGLILFFSAHPFLDSMLALATTFGVSTFVFVQWVAPFLSEFPEKVSAFYWARKVDTANTALMNMVSSNINQWSILSAMIPIIFVMSAGHIMPLEFDQHQRDEILLTILQSALGFILLLNMKLSAHEAAILFVFWLIQFVAPATREVMIYVYLAWCIFELVRFVFKREPIPAFAAFRATWQRRF